ncbi:MAG: RraA family protein [Clostridiaceae bacterium]|nr:RraA family protein [Clostridiaceae bacterium]
MSTPGLRIYEDFKRPDPELVEAFRNIPVANISDCMGRLFCLHSSIKPQGKCRKICGPALTVKSAMADNLLFNKAIALAKPGDVIVVNDSGDLTHSVCGDIMYQFAEYKKIGGFIVDGCVRDIQYLEEHDFPVYSRGVTPRGPYKNGFGEINTDIACADQVIHPGDIIVGDEDGVVVIRPEDAKELLEKAKAVVEREAKFDELIREGEWESSPGFKMIDNNIEKCGFEVYGKQE